MQNGPIFLTSGDLSTLDQSQQTEYGSVGVTGDGRHYRYVKFGGTATINAGLLMVTPVVPTGSTGLAIPTTNTTAQLSLGSTSIILTNGSTSVTQDQFAGGYLDILGTNAVESYQIAGNTAAGNAGAITVLLTDPLRNTTALANGTNTANLNLGAYNGVTASLTQANPVGFTILPVPNTATVTNWGWVLTRGHTFVSATTAVKGQAVKQDTAGTAGFVAVTAAATDFQIGVAQTAVASSTAPVEVNLP